MPIELILLLLFIGAGTGSVSAIIKTSPVLVAIPALYFFLPVYDLSLDSVILPVIATCLTAFIPTYLYTWIKSMKGGLVDFQRLINFTPGVVMGAVIGAQILSLINPNVFKVAFTIISIAGIFNIILSAKIEAVKSVNIGKFARLPIGLLVGVASLISGNCGRVLAGYLFAINKTSLIHRQGTIDGVVVFVSIAAMVGFIYPAQTFNDLGLTAFAGAIHLPSVLVLAVSHFFFFWFCENRGNELDKKVLSISFMCFLAFALIRLWI
ncbi:hypothetical protein MUS1_09295 [Marinomonas ushuaiensis DSM 15871]|uniref:Probable membrane transporter protein n=1 Tax=Marinomonas ushuaiensis DSM 15871 TaxID=1122207 RepID=X7E6R5_9GAMM|nr:sulfite exporter TauE/SafE family protein [Marinomonas ushuaiensis]ETX11652.1 hypothetical protein MUS1_09295 [Marinomonas ushuaiensis DSM 15871]